MYWVPDQVIVSIDLLAEALDRQELSGALDIVSGFADNWDTELRSLFGGEIAFEDKVPDVPEDAATLPPPPTGPVEGGATASAADGRDDGMEKGSL